MTFCRLLTKLLETLHDHLVCFPIDEEAPAHQELLDFATKLVTALGPAKLQNQAKSLMASLFSSRNEFFDKKVQAVRIFVVIYSLLNDLSSFRGFSLEKA